MCFTIVLVCLCTNVLSSLYRPPASLLSLLSLLLLPREPQLTTQSVQAWSRIDSNAIDISKVLRSVVGEGIAQANEQPDQLELQAFDKMRQDVERLVQDYHDFLELKIRFNVTPESVNKFPGLVHFIYVNRLRDAVVCPTLHRLDGDSPGAVLCGR